MIAGLKKRSFAIARHHTSVALEPEFWAALEAAAGEDTISLVELIARIDSMRGERPLASSLRVYALMRTMGPLATPWRISRRI